MRENIKINVWDYLLSKKEKFGRLTKEEIATAFEIGDPMPPAMNEFLYDFFKDNERVVNTNKRLPFRITFEVMEEFDVINATYGRDAALETMAGKLGLSVTTLKQQIKLFKEITGSTKHK